MVASESGQRDRRRPGRRRPVGRQLVEGARQGGEHPERQQVDLEEVELGEVVLVPLDDGPPRHGGRLDGHRLAERPARDDEAADVDGEVAREALQLAGRASSTWRTRGAWRGSRPACASVASAIGAGSS